MGSGVLSVRLWAPYGGAGAALGGAVPALLARSLGVPGKALRPRGPLGYQAHLRMPGNAVPSKTAHPVNIIDFTTAMTARSAPALRGKGARRTSSQAQTHRRQMDTLSLNCLMSPPSAWQAAAAVRRWCERLVPDYNMRENCSWPPWTSDREAYETRGARRHRHQG